MVAYRKGNYRVCKLNGLYVILDNRGKDCGRYERLGLAIRAIEDAILSLNA